MSTYLKQTKHPITGEWHEATWIDDYYGRHRYGVQFPDGGTYNPDTTKLETRDDETVSKTEKIEEMVRDFCSVVPKSKSEVRQRIQQAIVEERARVVGLYGTPICDNLHHKKNQRHTGGEICPVVQEINNLVNKI